MPSIVNTKTPVPEDQKGPVTPIFLNTETKALTKMRAGCYKIAVLIMMLFHQAGSYTYAQQPLALAEIKVHTAELKSPNEALPPPKNPEKCIYKWSITAGIGLSEYSGNLGVGFFRFDLEGHEIKGNSGSVLETNSPGISFISVNKYSNEIWDFSLKAYNGEWGYYKNSDSGNHFYRKVTAIEFTPRLKFLGTPLLTPYFTFGIGMRRVGMPYSRPDYGIFGKDQQAIYEVNVPLGLGMDIRISRRVGINIQSNFALTNNGRANSESRNGNDGLDHIWNHTIGLFYNLGGSPVRCAVF